MTMRTKKQTKKQAPKRVSKVETPAVWVPKPDLTKVPQDIHRRAMLASVNISLWSGRKFDKKATAEIENAHNVNDVGRFNKQLLAGARELHQKVIAAAMQARMIHYANTLPWSNDGWRLLPSANYYTYTELMRDARAKYEQVLAEFIDAYPALQAEARKVLKDLYNADEYPAQHQLARKFAFDVAFSPLPARGDFRLDLPDDEIKRVEAETADRVTKATAQAMTDAWSRLYEQTKTIFEKLNEPQAIFRDSLIGNARELIAVLQRLNLTQDAELDAMITKLAELATVEPQTLRDDEKVRKATADAAAEIMRQMQDIYG